MKESYEPLITRLEALKQEMALSLDEGEEARYLALRRQLLTLELEVTELQIQMLKEGPAPSKGAGGPAGTQGAPPDGAAPNPVRAGGMPEESFRRAAPPWAALVRPEAPERQGPPEGGRPESAEGKPADFYGRNAPAPQPKPAGSAAPAERRASPERSRTPAPGEGAGAAAGNPPPGSADRKYRYVADKQAVWAHAPTPPPRPGTAPPPNARPAPERERSIWGLTESKVGKYLLSLLASLLILLGCCVLILMGWSYMAPAVKAAVIALGGGGFLLAGGLLAKRLPAPFPDSLKACGMGILYADAVALHQAWGLVPLGGALLLILIWDGGCLLLGRRSRSKLYFYVLALGNLITAALTCQLIADTPFTPFSLLFVGAVQAGTILAHRKLYRSFDPVLAFSGGVTVLYLNAAYVFTLSSLSRPGGWLMLSLVLCLLLSDLLMWSADWILGMKKGERLLIGWICLVLPVFLLTLPITRELGRYAALGSGQTALMHHLPLLLRSVGALGLLAGPRMRRAAYCAAVPVLLLSVESLGRYYGLDVVGAGLVSLGALAVYTQRRSRLAWWVCILSYGFTLLLLWTLGREGAYYVAMVPALLFPAGLLSHCRRGRDAREVLGALAAVYMAVLVLLRGVLLTLGAPSGLILLSALGLLIALLPQGLPALFQGSNLARCHQKGWEYGYEGLLLLYTVPLAWRGAAPWETALVALLLVLHGLKLLYLAYFRWERAGQPGWGLGAAAILTVNLLRAAGLTPAGNWPILLSLLTIALAGGYIVLGFRKSAKSLRVFGLILSIAGVGKMVTLDVVGSPSLFRVAALLLGGLLCFGISFVYNYVEQIRGKQQNHGNQAEGSQPYDQKGRPGEGSAPAHRDHSER